MRLLLVDGSNIVMRAAFGGDIPPEQAVPTASGLITLAARQANATHMVIALDSKTPSWRKLEYHDYKANRTTDTTPWLDSAREYWNTLGWCVGECDGFEADDLIATLAARIGDRFPIFILSNDSDLLSLASETVTIIKPVNGGQFQIITPQEVCEKYGIPSPSLLNDFKALTGESGDNVPGVPGIGPKRAAKLISEHGGIDGIIKSPIKCADAEKVSKASAIARAALRLITLRIDAPMPAIMPKDCVFTPH